MRIQKRILKCLVAIALAFTSTAGRAGDDMKPPLSVRNVVDLLHQSGAEPVILRGETDSRLVVVAPKLVGRVMCSTGEGMDAPVNCYINPEQIRRGFSTDGKSDWNNFGGEERIWFAPEGGAHGLFFKKGEPQDWAHYALQFPLNAQQYSVLEVTPDKRSVKFSADFSLTNCAGDTATMEIIRQITILDDCPYATGRPGRVSHVGFESKTWLRNKGTEPLSSENMPLALWTIGMYQGGDDVIAALPYRSGDDKLLGPPVVTDYLKYFSKNVGVANEMWKAYPGCVLLSCSGIEFAKLELRRRRTLGRIGSINLGRRTITIMETNYQENMAYAASYFTPYEGDALDGGVVSVFTMKKEQDGKVNPLFHELECMSPVVRLNPGESFCHVSRTYHVSGENDALRAMGREALNLDPRVLDAFMQRISLRRSKAPS